MKNFDKKQYWLRIYFPKWVSITDWEKGFHIGKHITIMWGSGYYDYKISFFMFVNTKFELW